MKPTTRALLDSLSAYMKYQKSLSQQRNLAGNSPSKPLVGFQVLGGSLKLKSPLQAARGQKKPIWWWLAIYFLLVWPGSSLAAAHVWRITAYCPCTACCGKSDGITASGLKARPHHTVACNGLPFGTQLKIGKQVYVVEDRGAVSFFGSRAHPQRAADIFFASHAEARQFGVHYLIVEEG